MTDAGESTNATHGDNNGISAQAHSVGRDLNIYGSPKRSPWLLLAAVVVVIVVVSVLVVVANLSNGTKSADEDTSSPPLASTPPSAAGSSAAPTSAAQPPVAATGKPTQKAPPPQPQPQPPAQQPTTVKPAADGPGYLMPANTEKVADLYDGSKEAVMWAKEPPGAEGAKFQPNWVREFVDAGVFRIRNTHADLCLETATEAAARLEQVFGRGCSWSREHQLWREQNGNQYANVRSGECLVAGESDTYPNGTWLVVWTCENKADQQWRVVR
ncbi:RICIN domain-containing protein [Lentzea alba]|uniref:RICIN domain-containing protein n=1 Tax=Lentzea alba TaxID=2714351 RepID=UPI0039BFF271